MMLVVMLVCLTAEPAHCKRVEYKHPGVLSQHTCAAVILMTRALLEGRWKGTWRVDKAACLRRDMA